MSEVEFGDAVTHLPLLPALARARLVPRSLPWPRLREGVRGLVDCPARSDGDGASSGRRYAHTERQHDQADDQPSHASHHRTTVVVASISLGVRRCQCNGKAAQGCEDKRTADLSFSPHLAWPAVSILLCPVKRSSAIIRRRPQTAFTRCAGQMTSLWSSLVNSTPRAATLENARNTRALIGRLATVY